MDWIRTFTTTTRPGSISHLFRLLVRRPESLGRPGDLAAQNIAFRLRLASQSFRVRLP